jgi:hypothetical protein
MAINYTELKAAIQDYIQSTESTLTTNLDTIIRQAEDKILKAVDIPAFRRYAWVSCSVGSNSVAGLSESVLAPRYFFLTVAGEDHAVLPKDPSFLREFSPFGGAASGRPRYYAVETEAIIRVAPYPDQAYTGEFGYVIRPASIVTASTTWLGTHAEGALLNGCLLEASKFMKAEPDMVTLYKAEYTEALRGLEILAARTTGDNNRRGGA